MRGTTGEEPPRPRRSLRFWLPIPFLLLIRAYQLVLSPVMGGQCRFQPTCSRYAAEAYARHGVVRATWLTVRRIGRCHPLGGSGYDPVPPAEASRTRGGPARRDDARRDGDGSLPVHPGESAEEAPPRLTHTIRR